MIREWTRNRDFCRPNIGFGGQGNKEGQVKMECPVCHLGTLEAMRVNYPARKDGRWVLVENVPAMVCDVCGERTYTADIATRIMAVLSPTSVPIEARWTPVYDFDRINTAAPATIPEISTGAVLAGMALIGSTYIEPTYEPAVA